MFPRIGKPPSIPYNYNIARGKLGEYAIHKFGRVAGVGSAYVTVWDENDLYVYLSAATILKISSSSANDDSPAGSGVHEVVILGLDANYEIAQEQVVLAGQTAVNTINSYLRVFRIKAVLPDNTSRYNAGDIYAGTGAITAGVPAVIYGKMPVGDNQSQMALATAPANTPGYITEMHGTSGQVLATEVRLLIRPEVGLFQTKHNLQLVNASPGKVFDPPIKVAAKSDVELQAKTPPTAGDLTAGFTMILDPKGAAPVFL